MAVEEKVKAILLEILEIKGEDIVPSARLEIDLDANSVDMVEIYTALENEFNIEIPEDEVKDMERVQDIVTYLEAKIAG